MRIGSFKDLIAWQKGMELVEEVYRLTAVYPADERFGLTSQSRRAVMSIPANIAEGYGRRSRADYVHFLDISRGLANELETELLIAVRLGFIHESRASRALALTNEVQRILKGLVNSLETSHKTNVKN